MTRIIRLAVIVAAVSLACGTLAAQKPGDQVVAKITLKAPENKENPIFAEMGDLLTVQESKGNTVLLQTAGSRRGWVRAEDVIAVADAAPVYDRLIKEEPQNPWHYSGRALVYNLNGDKPREIADLNQAIKLGIKSASVWVNRGAAHATAGDLDKAIADYSEAIKLGYKEPNVYMNRAVALLSKGQAKEAIADFDAVVAAQPTSIFALLQRGIAHQQLQDWDKAIADFSAVMKLDPKHQQAISSRGYTYFLKNEPKSAVKDFSEVIKLNPKSVLAYNNRGYNRQMYGEYKQALADFDKAIEVEPKFALAWQNKAWLLACCPDDKIRDGKLAFNAAKTAGELRDWKVISDVKSLAAAYAESTDFTRAVEWQKKAVAMAEGDAKTAEVELLKLYEAKTPFRFAPPKE